MRGCAGIAALNALRHPKARVSLPSGTRNIKTKRSKAKSQTRKKQTLKNPKQEQSKARKIKSTKARAGLCPADSRGGCPYVGLLDLPDPATKGRSRWRPSRASGKAFGGGKSQS
jgi:hypothetical protein